MAKKKLEDFTWTGNSKKMYDEMTGLLPAMYKAIFNKKFEVWLNDKEDGTVTEANILHTIEKNGKAVPKLVPQFMEIYNKYKTE